MNSSKKKLFLLDAMALIYRAHFAFSKNPRINSKGVNTSAAFGFTNTLFEVLTKEKPTHIAVAFDTSAPTFRHKQFEAYKANRQEQPEDIRVAIPIVKDIVRAFDIPVLELDGYEADDIIGTIAKRASCEEFTVYMMTPDKDYAQLVEDCVFLYKPAFMGNGVEILGVPEVLKKFDIERVEQVTDILGLQGDSVDNIPGIPGVGAKTAVKLLKQFGSVEGVVENADQLKGKQKEKVIEFGQQGILSKELATIKIDVPVDFDAEMFSYNGPDEEAVRKIFQELEFRALTRRVLGSPAEQAANTNGQTSLFEEAAQSIAEQPTDLKSITEVVHDYQLIDTAEKRKELVRELEKQEAFCFDTETDSLDPLTTELVGLAFSFQKGTAFYVAVPEGREEIQAIVNEFKPLLEDQKKLKIAQNLKFDMLVLRKYGVEIQGAIFDTMIAHYLIDPETGHGMDVMAENYLKYKPVSIESLIGKKGKKQGNMRDIPAEEITEYAGEDADITLQLKETFSKEIEKDSKLRKLFYEMELPLIPVLAAMEYEGVRIDTSALEELSADLSKELVEIEKEIFEVAGTEFNIGSPKQLGEVLFDKMKLVDKPKKTKSGQYATGENILSALATEHEIARRILDFREVLKLKNTYVDALPKLISDYDGRIHTSYNQAVTSTGRLSSTNPNLQNIPIRTPKGQLIRKAFVPRNEDYLLMSADYSQVELRIMASFSRDESMMEAFRLGRDIHATTAAKIFDVKLEEVTAEMRRKAKTANFGIIYGVSAFGLAQQLSIPRGEASEIIKAYFKEFPSIKNYMDAAIKQAREKEYVETIRGRRRYLRDINSRNPTVRGYAERNAINAPIQGTAADMIKLAMVNIHHWMEKEKLKSSMIMQVHDELIFDVHQSETERVKEKVVELMKDALPLEVPMEVEADIAKNWLEAH
ncbi:DNA polymerase-1 [Catalinimonas alkaloidigena]|uniref:DNA polymerase I n=1 Tax=Catalinimonas alkaloidigena TaxID=1075417 RepID=UPI002406231B|nr:DNA polymerase I [Catalinimonas alkaloidigena]MDF9801113.1 DNA polymerase-1 [Catalinimonas alkaloidigena]